MALISIIMSCLTIILSISVQMVTKFWRNAQGNFILRYLMYLLCTYNCQMVLELELYKGSQFCVVFAYLKYFFRICSDLWLTVMIFSTLRSIKETTILKSLLTKPKDTISIVRYSCLVEFVAFYYVVVVNLCDLDIKTVPWIPFAQRPNVNTQLCWFGNSQSVIYYWILPRFFITQVNSILLILMTRAYYILQTKLEKNELSHEHLKDRLNEHVRQYVMAVKLFITVHFPLLCEIILETFAASTTKNSASLQKFREITSHIVSLEGVYFFIIFVIVSKFPKKIASHY